MFSLLYQLYLQGSKLTDSKPTVAVLTATVEPTLVLVLVLTLVLVPILFVQMQPRLLHLLPLRQWRKTLRPPMPMSLLLLLRLLTGSLLT
jgi:hypothetical protein